jgi:hypothetical protein
VGVGESHRRGRALSEAPATHAQRNWVSKAVNLQKGIVVGSGVEGGFWGEKIARKVSSRSFARGRERMRASCRRTCGVVGSYTSFAHPEVVIVGWI